MALSIETTTMPDVEMNKLLPLLRQSLKRNPKEYQTIMTFVADKVGNVKRVRASQRNKLVADLYAEVHPKVARSRKCRDAAVKISAGLDFKKAYKLIKPTGPAQPMGLLEKVVGYVVGAVCVLIILVIVFG